VSDAVESVKAAGAHCRKTILYGQNSATCPAVRGYRVRVTDFPRAEASGIHIACAILIYSVHFSRSGTGLVTYSVSTSGSMPV
jgi:hypothetical protein